MAIPLEIATPEAAEAAQTLLSGGKTGELFASLAFAGALLATFSFFMADKTRLEIKKGWEFLAVGGWGLHSLGILGIMGTMFYLIYSHQYNYHYVWSHSSNELPIHFMISCFWEGQEGSFLLWSFWHTVLGTILLFFGRKWRNPVLFVVSSVELILSSMLLGIYPASTFEVFGIAVPAGYAIVFIALLLAPAGYLFYRFFKTGKSLTHKGFIHLAGGLLAVGLVPLILESNTGFWKGFQMADSFASVGNMAMSLLVIGLGLFCLLLISVVVLEILAPEEKKRLNGYEALAGFGIAILAMTLFVFDLDTFKIGSSPFLTLADAFPEAPIFAQNPDFVPTNGKGLNPLLQNYWMVIHPPTLFLGFASTVVPFAYVIAGLLRGKMQEWIKPAVPWMVFSVMILGVGIIMGGYWAYETLNFGGYWNWDPVENSSLVPWIFGIGAVHALLAKRHSRVFVKRAGFMVIMTFLLVLYSTFLTRSGILGETSVHTFTDLGLSGQLVALIGIYLFAVIMLVIYRYKDLPKEWINKPFWSKEWFFFLGIIVLFFAGTGISLSTSMPVINKLFGSNLAPPSQVQFYYYRWNVYWAIWIGVLSGLAQFIYWRRIEKKKISSAIFWPVFLALLSAVTILVLIIISKWEFAFDSDLRNFREVAAASTNGGVTIRNFMKYLLFLEADELMLIASLFTIFANGSIIISLLKRGKKVFLSMGGSVAHIGFGLMLIGIYFSSGYSDIVSINPNPEELSPFPEAERADNVFLIKDQPRFIKGYQVTYRGEKSAKPPLTDLGVLEQDNQYFKVKFRDESRDFFSTVLPHDPSFYEVNEDNETEVNEAKVLEFLTDNLGMIKPSRLNERTLFGLEFVPWKTVANYDELDDSDAFFYDKENNIGYELAYEKTFTLYPESELNPGMGGMVSHPSRKVFLTKDIYVHVSSMPNEEEQERKFEYYTFEMAVGDSATTQRGTLVYDQLSPLEPNGDYEVRAEANLRLITKQGETITFAPIYRIDKNNFPSTQPDYKPDQETTIAFVQINPETGKITLNVQEEDIKEDWVVIQAVRKPWINFLWLGTFVMTFGFIITIVRRAIENSKMSKRDDK